MPIDLYDTRTMLAVIERMPPVPSFLLDTFFPNTVQFDTETVDIDIYIGGKKLAPIVSPVIAGKVVARAGYSTQTFKPPYLKPKKVTTAQQTLKRSAGDSLYSTRTPLDRAREMVGRDLRELNEMCMRREEWMAAQALVTGALVASGEGAEVNIDFQMPAANKITLTGSAAYDSPWTDGSAKPLTWLRDKQIALSQSSSLRPNVLVLGAAAGSAFLDNPSVRETLNSRRFEAATNIRPTWERDDVIFVGTFFDPAMDVYIYAGTYTDDAGSAQSFLPTDRAVFGSNAARNYRAYAVVQDVEAIEAGQFAVARYPKSWTEKDPSVRWLKMESAALPVLSEPAAFLSVDVR